MKRCPVCGKTFADTKMFCNKDGTRLVPVAEDTDGSILNKENLIRRSDAADVEWIVHDDHDDKDIQTNSAMEETAPQVQRKTRKRNPLISILVILLIIAAVTVVIFLGYIKVIDLPFSFPFMNE